MTTHRPLAEIAAEIEATKRLLVRLLRERTAAKRAPFLTRNRGIVHDLIAGMGYPAVMEKYGVTYMTAALQRHKHKARRHRAEQSGAAAPPTHPEAATCR